MPTSGSRSHSGPPLDQRSPMPVEAWMPAWDVRSSHHVQIHASPDTVYAAILQTDFAHNPVLRLLMGIRAIPALLLAPRQAYRHWRDLAARRASSPVSNLLNSAFTRLEAAPPSDLVFGLTGRFWTPAGGLIPTAAGTFRDEVPAGLARAVWGFHVEQVAPGQTRLSTET